jgi:hypothetical protein
VNRSQVAQDVLDAIRACNPAICDEYRLLRSRGLPPADCNSIATSWVRRDVEYLEFSDCEGEDCNEDLMWDAIHELRVTITRICMGPDGQPAWDTSLEDDAAVCFDDDLDELETCLQCTDWTQLRIDHALDSFKVGETIHDLESDGGAFSAHVTIVLKARECCS